MVFFNIQVPVSKSLLSSIKLFLCMFCSHLNPNCCNILLKASWYWILHPMHLQVLGLQSLPSCLHILVISSLSNLYFSIFPTSLSFTRSSPGMVTSTILTSVLVLSITTTSDRRPSILVSHWIVKSHRILWRLFSITLSGSCSCHCCALWKSSFSHSFL